VSSRFQRRSFASAAADWGRAKRAGGGGGGGGGGRGMLCASIRCVDSSITIHGGVSERTSLSLVSFVHVKKVLYSAQTFDIKVKNSINSHEFLRQTEAAYNDLVVDCSACVRANERGICAAAVSAWSAGAPVRGLPPALSISDAAARKLMQPCIEADASFPPWHTRREKADV